MRRASIAANAPGTTSPLPLRRPRRGLNILNELLDDPPGVGISQLALHDVPELLGMPAPLQRDIDRVRRTRRIQLGEPLATSFIERAQVVQ
jgi:hypothetical protein